ncbi:MAG: acyl-CoA dehydrogenase family protein [Dehalococcoidia bacterium]|nr:acyl-CoA dehydrogenase family protein [Dehalococcoidia bacterium]
MKGQFSLNKAQEMMRKNIRRLAEEQIAPRVAQIEATETFPADIVELFRKQKLMGMAFPTEYGGGGGDEVILCILMEELSRVFSDSVLWCCVSQLGAQPILLAGSEAQKRRYMPDLASGKTMCALGLTEPEAGSDVAGLRTSAVRDGDHYVLNGGKRFISLGNVADYVTIFAKTDPSARHKGLSVFLVEKGTPGFTVARLEDKLGWRSTPTAELVLKNCRVPVENLLGVEGQGWEIAMRTLDLTRPGVGAIGVGIAQGAYETALGYAKERKAFGAPIASFQAIQLKLADMAIDIEAARLLVYKAAALVDEESPLVPYYASIAKTFATDAAMRVTTEAIQVLGGSGYIKDFAVERYFREAKLTQIFEGANEVQRLNIAREVLREGSSMV